MEPSKIIQFLPQYESIATEIIAGTIGGIFVGLFTFIWSFIKRKRAESLFPVEGEYISFFDDTEKGQPVVRRSTSSVRQRGNSVKISTTLSDKRSWSLHGSILPGGHVSGVYSADAIYDEGVGSFYLKIGDGSLEGMWNGYDHENRTISGGRYWFRRRYYPKIRDFKKSDFSHILHTANNAFGRGYFSPNFIINDRTHFALVAKIDGKFVGYSAGRFAEIDYIHKIKAGQDRPVPLDICHAHEHGKLGIIQSVAIMKKFRGHGIGTDLIIASEEKLKSLDAQAILVPAWQSPSGIHLENILHSLDYSIWFENKSIWTEECETGKFGCPHFKEKCQCSVIFYRKGRI